MLILARRVGTAVLCILMGACALRETHPPAPVLPPGYGEAAAAGGQWPSEDWYRSFGSAELNVFIEQAAGNNLDVRRARAQVQQADARSREAGAAILPSVEAGANGNYLAGHSSAGSAHETDWAVLLSASYEVDFWGKNRATARAANALAQSSRADRDTVALTALAGVATDYFDILSLRERLNIAVANRDAAQKLLLVIQSRFDAGWSNPIELAAQKATLASTALIIPELEQREAQALAALALLLGREPERFVVDGRGLDALLEPRVSAGLPSELLTRRPDIVSAEANMRAANADLTAARAALFPSLSLTASGGVQNPALNAAVISLSGAGPTLNLGAALTQPIFDGGRLRAVRAQAQAKEEELVLAYRAAILAALVDVENALSGLRHLDEAREFQQENVAQSERAFSGATLRFKEGSGDYLSVLESQRTLFAARDQYSQYKLARLQALVVLCKALGGGWQASPLTAAKESR